MGLDFSDTSDYQGLLQHINFLCGLPATDTTRYTTKDKTRNLNIAYRTVLSWIWKAQGDWVFDDSNLNDLNYFKTNCVSGQDDYTLPTGYGIVERIEYKDAQGIWHKLTPISQSELQNLAKDEFFKTSGIPTHVELFANSYRLYSAADRTSSDGDSIRVYCTRDIDAFVVGDTTQEPGFNANFHHVLPILASQIWAVREKDQNRYNMLELDIQKIKAEVDSYYGNRANMQQERIRPRNRQRNAR